MSLETFHLVYHSGTKEYSMLILILRNSIVSNLFNFLKIAYNFKYLKKGYMVDNTPLTFIRDTDSLIKHIAHVVFQICPTI